MELVRSNYLPAFRRGNPFMEKHKDPDDKYRSLREFARVDGHLPIEVRALPEEERPYVVSRISLETALTENQEMPEHSDRVLAECLRILNAKLDSIIRLLAVKSADHKSMRIEEVNISAGGVSTYVQNDFRIGDLVEIRIVLPTSPYSIFYIYGNVIKFERECSRNRVSIEYTNIDEDIRENIVKYVFERQREILRKKRRLEAD